jgi:hypothetical protein
VRRAVCTLGWRVADADSTSPRSRRPFSRPLYAAGLNTASGVSTPCSPRAQRQTYLGSEVLDEAAVAGPRTPVAHRERHVIVEAIRVADHKQVGVVARAHDLVVRRLCHVISRADRLSAFASQQRRRNPPKLMAAWLI